ncbi:MAG: hypothetical protein EGR13_07470, partial [Coprococcus comes]|nr:hypothetical protein [Coprococcus comes]
MKKMNSKTNIMILCAAFALSVSTTPANAAMYDSFPAIYQDIQSQSGMNQMHDSNYLRERSQENYRNEDYNYYQQRKKLDNKDEGSTVIQNYNGGSMQQATIEEMNTKGVYVNSIEVAPSEILTKEEINKIVQPLVGRNVFIEDIQKVIDGI